MDALKTETAKPVADIPQPGSGPGILGEVQTDHPILPIPFTAEIDGRQCRGEGLSLVRAHVAGLLDPALQDQERLVRLSFAFQGFTLSLGVRCRIDAIEGGKAALVFLDPMGDHLPQLRHLLNGWIAGDLMSLGQVLSVTTAPVKPGKSGAAVGAQGNGLAGRLIGGTLMAGALVALVGAAMVLTYARGYTSTLPLPGRIAPEGQTLTALSAGQIDYVNPAAKSGEVAFTLRAQDGTVLSVTMPCDCTATLLGQTTGSTVQAGDAVMAVHEADAAQVVTALVPAEMLMDLARAERVTATLPDGTRLDLAVPQALPLPASGDAAPVPVALSPLAPLASDHSGGLARITLSQPAPLVLAPARGLLRALGL